MNCFFKQNGDICGALMWEHCNGFKKGCKFYKTERQFLEEQNKSILINQKKGNCENCKYRKTECKLTNLPEI